MTSLKHLVPALAVGTLVLTGCSSTESPTTPATDVFNPGAGANVDGLVASSTVGSGATSGSGVTSGTGAVGVGSGIGSSTICAGACVLR